MKHTNQLPALLVGCLLAVVMTASARVGFAATQSEAAAHTGVTPDSTTVRTIHHDTGTITAALESDSDLDTYIETRLESAHMPSLAAAIIKNGEIIWSKAYGLARVYRGEPASTDFLYMLASVSKTVAGTALMRVWESGGLDLDADVSTYLPFPVVHPLYPDTPITARMLLTHTAAIKDNWPVLESLYGHGDSPIPLAQFLQDYLTPDGAYYDPQANFQTQAPGAVYQYSNVGVTLAAFLVETITGTPFDQYCEQFIFEPLGMSRTSWHLAGLDQSTIAMPYGYLRLARLFYPYGFYGYPDYPDGALRTTVNDLARFLTAFIQFGSSGETRILKRETVEEMRRVQFPSLAPNQGLVWYYKELSGWTLLGHNGGDRGVATEMFFRPSDGVGVILLMNGSWSRRNSTLVLEIETRLFQEADHY